MPRRITVASFRRSHSSGPHSSSPRSSSNHLSSQRLQQAGRRRRAPTAPASISRLTTPHADHDMSALDQALTKAYAKDRRAIASPTVAEAGSRPLTTAAPAIRAHAIDQIYHEGVLYRVETQPLGAE